MSYIQQVKTYITSLGYEFDPDFSQLKNKWVYVDNPSLKGAYVFDVHVLKDKREVVVFTIYDYRKSQSFTEKFSDSQLTAGELRGVNAKIKEQEKAAQEEKERKWEETRKYCWGEYSVAMAATTHPYLTKKNFPVVSESLCFRTRANLLGKNDLLVPIHDTEKNFWGYQCIHEDGEKQFTIGQRMDGVFFPIHGGSDSRIYVAEGVATALSISTALDHKYLVVAALNAGNLLKVAKALRLRYARSPIIICADNDCWKPEIGNTGVEKAEEVCRCVDGTTLVVPYFKSTATKPTDFNDLHALDGLAEVAEQISKVSLQRPNTLYSLGHNKGDFFFTSSANPQIQSIREFSQDNFLKLRPLKYWELHYTSEKGIDWSRAKDDIIQEAYKKGLFDFGKVRGRGVWLEKDEPIIHLGDRLHFPNGTEKDLSDLESENIYDPKQKVALPEKEEMKNATQANNIIKRFSWEKEFDHALFMGWIFQSALSGMSDWRAHMALTAQAGSGKTTLLTHIVEPCLKYFRPLKVEGTSEAGIRQLIGSDSIPVIADEFDTNSMKENSFDKILNLIRMSSSEGVVVRGTPSGKAMRFTAKFSILLSGVNMPMFKEADKTRITALELLKAHQEKSWPDFQKEILSIFNDTWSKAFFWQVYSSAVNFKQTVGTLQEILSQQFDARTGQQYSALLSGYWHWFNTEKISVDSAQELVKKLCGWVEGKTKAGAIHTSDSEACFEHLMGMVVKKDIDQVQVTLGELLNISEDSVETKNKLLFAYGIKIEKNGIFIANSNHLLKKHFDNTPWVQWNMSLKRLGETNIERSRFGPTQIRGLKIKVDIKEEEF